MVARFLVLSISIRIGDIDQVKVKGSRNGGCSTSSSTHVERLHSYKKDQSLVLISNEDRSEELLRMIDAEGVKAPTLLVWPETNPYTMVDPIQMNNMRDRFCTMPLSSASLRLMAI